jgi:hypothetical protein
MNSHPTFRVVGIRANGERTVISQHNTRDIAERAMHLISADSSYLEIVILPQTPASQEIPVDDSFSRR